MPLHSAGPTGRAPGGLGQPSAGAHDYRSRPKSLAVINYPLPPSTYTSTSLPPPPSTSTSLHHHRCSAAPSLHTPNTNQKSNLVKKARRVRREDGDSKQSEDERASEKERDVGRESGGGRRGRRRGELVLARQCKQLFTQSRGRVCQAGDCSVKY